MTYGTNIVSSLEAKCYERFKMQYNPIDYIPNIDELFEIIKYANDIHNIVGCCTINVRFYINYIISKF